MQKRMTESEIVSNFDSALENEDFFILYQPKINHTTGRMIGAEALMRWKHPEYGIQFPSDFIPVFENNDLIYRADLFVFEKVCGFQRKCLDSGIPTVPISVNLSRYDIYKKNYVDMIEQIRKKYDISARLIHIEITETSAIGGMELVSGVLDMLHGYGYTVEMDDFGSGYSSLNVLKDLPVDVIKLDMRFLSGEVGGRGGTIINAVVQMSKWLDTPVVAEGVETMEQADYMKSIGCNYIQGYLYSKPVTEEEFVKKLKTLEHEPMSPAMELLDAINAGRFWDPDSLETLIFSNLVGGAIIFEYRNDDIEILRVNEKYLYETGMRLTEKEVLEIDPWKSFDEENLQIYKDTMLRAIKSMNEEVCDTWRTVCSKTCGSEKICVRSFMRVIGKTDSSYLFYVMIQNITAEKKLYNELYKSDLRFRAAFEHANMYAWEYNVATKEMRPCFRCMRDLGLPPLVKNYPESAIKIGIIPQDYADMYRDWFRQIENGVKYLEGIIPMTVGRVPFHVRYTVEFDENGRPLKAYGSATLVVDK